MTATTKMTTKKPTTTDPASPHTRETLSAALVIRGIAPGHARATAGAVIGIHDDDRTYPPDRHWMRAILSGNVRALDLLVRRCVQARSSG